MFDPPAAPSLPIAGATERFPVRRVHCIGRNYAAHAIEIGHDPDREPPFFLLKNPDNLASSGESPTPTQTSDVHHGAEPAVVLRPGSTNIAVDAAFDHVLGYALALDMARRDLQGAMMTAGRPWEIGKAFERYAPIGPVHPVALVGHPAQGARAVRVNGTLRQEGDFAQMIWNVPEMISHLSAYVALGAGDVILSGTPSGDAPVQPGDLMDVALDGVASLSVRVV
ncbi:MAG: fumarylacetoacetate hydrolase family protein [Pseudomonadota bacterium]